MNLARRHARIHRREKWYENIENKTTLEVQKKILAKFSGKSDADGSYMHRKSPDAEVIEARSKDMTGNPIIKAKAKLSLYDVEYKLDNGRGTRG